MTKLDFDAEVVMRSTPERAFDYFADYRHVAPVLEGVTQWEPIGSKSTGVGARYNVEMVVFGFPVRTVLRLNSWRRPDEIGWVSETGLIKQEGGFRFAKVPEGVKIDLRITYEPPAAAIGVAIAQRADKFIRRRLQRALERIRDTIEASPP